MTGPTSQEVGGLKYRDGPQRVFHLWSHLAGGGWIEISTTAQSGKYFARSHLAGGGWIEILSSGVFTTTAPSPTSQEVGGLKYRRGGGADPSGRVPPRRRWVD